jgi:predicted glycogen debranching enzyme
LPYLNPWEAALIAFDQPACADLSTACSREWLETNGLGGFASSTITGLNTRRYHGLLVAATRPPVGRMVLLSKLEETLIIGNQRYELSCNEYPGAVHPQGHCYLRQFRLDPFPIFTYEVEGFVIEKRVFMLHGENTTVIEYALLKSGAGGKRSLSLELRPLISFRDYHSTTHENNALNREAHVAAGCVSFTPYAGSPALHLAHNASSFDSGGDWYRRFQYARERERGLDFEEDLFNPGALKFAQSPEIPAVVIASIDVLHQANEAAALRQREIARRAKIAASAPANDDFTRALVVAADQFIVARGEQKTVIAGYPWFSDWGRDTMISLPGLTLATGRYDVARSILLEFSKHVSQGMLPNRFPDSGEAPEYNTVDATLWYFEAIRAYVEAAGDLALARQLYPVLLDIVQWHVKGTRHGIHVEEGNGLLAAGEPGVQLTWMDAKVGDWVVTPRIGKPVEIQALWYNALRVMEDFAARFSDEVARKRFNRMATLAQYSFNRLFWNESAQCLYDVVNGTTDGSLRPNQILAVSLPYSMLSAERARLVVDRVERDLLTPAGLRTLAANDSRYLGRYGGDQRCRDAAYHMGTVWPWLMGPFITAYLRTHAASTESVAARELVTQWLAEFERQLSLAGLGQIAEIHEGNAPHNPCGCVAQAWSVAELLRVKAELARASQPAAAALSRG